MVQASVNGLLVPPGDSDALAEALARISRQPDFLRRLKQASTRSVLPRFSWRRNGEDLIRAIDKIVNYTKRQSRSQTSEATSGIGRLT
jgi:glycosyltransferase involved in cell wall biosynthesis